MKLNDKVYEVLKWVALIMLPAFKIAIPALFEVWGWNYGEQIGQTIDIIAILIGTLIGASTIEYAQRSNDEVE